MSATLLPCPCCGGPASSWTDYLSNPINMTIRHAGYVVRCEMPARGGCGLTTQRCVTEQEAIAVWNRRAQPTAGADAEDVDDAMERVAAEVMEKEADDLLKPAAGAVGNGEVTA